MTFSPTASKVASTGEKNPNPVPPRKLPKIPATGQRIRGNGKERSIAIFRVIPSFFVLVIKGQLNSIFRSHELFCEKGKKGEENIPDNTVASPKKMSWPKSNNY